MSLCYQDIVSLSACNSLNSLELCKSLRSINRLMITHLLEVLLDFPVFSIVLVGIELQEVI
jgi:hypothetical protein